MRKESESGESRVRGDVIENGSRRWRENGQQCYGLNV